jgi:Ca2+/Na+ antiporter
MSIIQDGVSTTREATAMIALYFFYVGFVVGRYLWTLPKAKTTTTLEEVDCSIGTPEDDLTPIPLPDQSHFSRLGVCFRFLSKPLTLFFHWTIPSVRSEKIPYSPLRTDLETVSSSPLNFEINRLDATPALHVAHPQRYLNCLLRRQNDYDGVIGDSYPCHPLVAGTEQIVGLFRASLCRALLCILICILYIGLFASLIVQSSSIIVAHVGLSQTTIGATFVSLGTEVPPDHLSLSSEPFLAQIPDIVSSIVLSRDGYYGAALAGATGSQVHCSDKTVHISSL